MRILHLSTRLIQGGSQENTILSCEGQANLAHDVHLAFGPIYGPEGSMLQRVTRFRTPDHRAITTHELPHLLRRIAPTNDLRAYLEIAALIRRIRPDVVHTHSSKAGILGRVAAWRTRPRPAVVHTVHGPPFHKYESTRNNALYIAAERIAAKHCHLIACVAHAMRDQFLAANIAEPSKYRVVYSGMETDAFLHPAPGEDRQSVRAELDIPQGAWVIGTVARLAELKGHDDILDALAEELRQRPDWRLLWVGDGWWRQRLLARAESLRIADRIITTGMVPTERVPAMLRAMDLALHPSYREGLPRVVPQALLAGVPVVANDVDGTREACIDFNTGRLVPPGDTRALRDAVLWMHDNPDAAAETVARGRELCAQRFTAQAMVDALEHLYAEAIAINEGRSP